MKINRLAIIINPAAGQPQSILDIFNKIFTKANIDWDVFITKKSGDAARFAQKILNENFDAVAVYGGDGTIKEVASKMINSEIPIAIIPGGTANVLASELKIPFDTYEACELLLSSNKIRQIDICRINNEYFILRAGIGLEAIMIHRVSRFLKNELGLIAYVISAIQAIFEARNSHYKIITENEVIELDGITCLIANSANIGISGIKLFDTKVDDGYMDIIVIRNPNFRLSILNLFKRDSKWMRDLAIAYHLKAKQVHIEFSKDEKIQLDGEISTDDSVDAEILHKAIKFIV